VRTQRFDLPALLKSGGVQWGNGSERVKQKRRKKRRQAKKKAAVELKKGAAVSASGMKRGRPRLNRDVMSGVPSRIKHMQQQLDVESSRTEPIEGDAFTTQFGSLLPPLKGGDAAPDCIVFCTRSVAREPAAAALNAIRALDAKYSFGAVLRGSTAPDFISISVAPEAHTETEDPAGSEQTSMVSDNAFDSKKYRERVERASTWLLSAVVADSRVLSRIPALAAMHLILIVAHRILSRCKGYGLWSDFSDILQDSSSWDLYFSQKEYKVDAELICAFSLRLVGLMGMTSSDAAGSNHSSSSFESVAGDEKPMTPEKIAIMKSRITQLLKLLSDELGHAESGRRQAARIVTYSLSRALDVSSVTTAAQSSPENILVNQPLAIGSAASKYLQEVLKLGPSWQHFSQDLWRLESRMNESCAVRLDTLVCNILSQVLAVETDPEVILNVTDSLLCPSASKHAPFDLRITAATSGLIGLLCSRPHIAQLAFSRHQFNYILNVFGRLVDDVAEGCQIDGIMKVLTDTDEINLMSDASFDLGVALDQGQSCGSYVLTRIPIIASKSDVKMPPLGTLNDAFSPKYVWTDELLLELALVNRIGADFQYCKISVDALKALLIALSFWQHTPGSTEGESLIWKNIMNATLVLLNCTSPPALYQHFSKSLHLLVLRSDRFQASQHVASKLSISSILSIFRNCDEFTSDQLNPYIARAYKICTAAGAEERLSAQLASERPAALKASGKQQQKQGRAAAGPVSVLVRAARDLRLSAQEAKSILVRLSGYVHRLLLSPAAGEYLNEDLPSSYAYVINGLIDVLCGMDRDAHAAAIGSHRMIAHDDPRRLPNGAEYSNILSEDIKTCAMLVSVLSAEAAASLVSVVKNESIALPPSSYRGLGEPNIASQVKNETSVPPYIPTVSPEKHLQFANESTILCSESPALAALQSPLLDIALCRSGRDLDAIVTPAIRAAMDSGRSKWTGHSTAIVFEQWMGVTWYRRTGRLLPESVIDCVARGFSSLIELDLKFEGKNVPISLWNKVIRRILKFIEAGLYLLHYSQTNSCECNQSLDR
jgi:hypothetical protein